MKQVFLMLVFWAGMVHGAFAGYDINVTGSNCNFTCTITPDNATTWTIGDLITWIFPDGQFKQSTIYNDNGTLKGDIINWVPWTPNLEWKNNKKVVGIVTKKGGTGNPSIIYQDKDVTSYACGNYTSQSTFPFSNNPSISIGKLWDFARDASNYLTVTYRQLSGCDIKSEHRIIINLPENVSFLGYIPYNGEIVDQLNSSTLSIRNLKPGPGYRNIFLNLGTNGYVSEGVDLDFHVLVTMCENFDTDVSFDVNQHPHDPNSKTVNIKEICPGKTTPTLLHYKVQFHNDGEVPVKKVRVIDSFPPELNPATFVMTHAPTVNGISGAYTHSISGNVLEVEFNGAGLPGLGSTTQSYLYHETIYQFEFDIETNPVVKKSFPNYVSIFFYDDFDKGGGEIGFTELPPVKTDLEWVKVGCRKKPKFCDCLRLLFRRKG